MSTYACLLFYYSKYQSILFCVECVIKILSHNDVCECLSIVLYLLIPHSYNPHLSDPSHLLIEILIYLSYFTALEGAHPDDMTGKFFLSFLGLLPIAYSLSLFQSAFTVKHQYCGEKHTSS